MGYITQDSNKIKSADDITATPPDILASGIPNFSPALEGIVFPEDQDQYRQWLQSWHDAFSRIDNQPESHSDPAQAPKPSV